MQIRRLLEGRAFAIRKQHRLHVERGGEIGRLRPESLIEIGILQGFVVAMQIEDKIGAERHMQELSLQTVGSRIIIEVFDQRRPIDNGDQRKIPVEVGAGAEVETTLQFAEMRLRGPDRVGLRHDGDVACDRAFAFRLPQPLCEEMQKRRSRQLVGMKPSLDIDLRRLRIAARKPQHRQPPRRSRRIAWDDDLRNVHPALLRVCHPDGPFSFMRGNLASASLTDRIPASTVQRPSSDSSRFQGIIACLSVDQSPGYWAKEKGQEQKKER